MSDDEPDYMSDEFLTAAATSDVRPGLLHSHKQKRDHEVWKKKESAKEMGERRKPIATLEEEARTDGLQKPIAEDNKGFAMLAKMGFNPGAGLGRRGQGRTEPVKIDLKTDKQGLGRQTALKEVLERKRKILEERKKNAPSIEDYRATLSEKAQERQADLDLKKSQRVCYNLDQEWNIEEPDETWFWPEFTQEDGEVDEGEGDGEEEEEEGPQLTTRDKLELLTVYLRRNHLYCIWCGVKFQDEDDMRDCPGPTRADHDV